MATAPRIVIVGGGISGLALAYQLRKSIPSSRIQVLESADRPGGKIQSENTNGFLVEHGPNGFLETKPSTLQLCRDLRLDDDLITASEASRKHRFLYLNEKLRELPGGPFGLLTTRLLSWRGKIALIGELLRRGATPKHDESVGDFFRRRLGREAAEVLGDALVTGIHGGDPELLSLASAFPRAAEMELKYGSVIRGFLRAAKQRRRDAEARGETPAPAGRMWSLRRGLGQLAESLAEQASVTYGVSVRRVERAASGWLVRGDGNDQWEVDAVALTCPAYEQAAMLADLNPDLAAELAGIAYNKIAVVAVGYRAADVPNVPAGFGFIAPQRTRRDLLGVQWCSAIYPGRAPDGCVLWRALCGGWNRPEVVDWDDQRLLNAVRAELRLALRVEAPPVFSRIVRWDRAIPQYHVGHRDRVARIDHLAAIHPGLFVGGNALRGVALNDCTEQAGLLAAAVSRWTSGQMHI